MEERKRYTHWDEELGSYILNENMDYYDLQNTLGLLEDEIEKLRGESNKCLIGEKMTKEEYLQATPKIEVYMPEWSKALYDCPKCGRGKMHKDLLHCRCLTSFPPQYRYTYICDMCSYSEELDR